MARTVANNNRGSMGTITGYVLKLARVSAGLSQEALAEALEVSLDTVQGWESGRRPLSATRVAVLAGVRHMLTVARADQHLIAALDPAMEADWIIGQTLEQGAGHPFAGWVATRRVHDLLVWALVGQPPLWLPNPARNGQRDGLVRHTPMLSVPQRHVVFTRLRDLAEQADSRHIHGIQLRRQAAYLAGYDPAPDTGSWLDHLPETPYSQGGWSPEWVAIRSRAISMASRGNPEPLRWFIDHALAEDDQLELAQLTWNAYYYGELDTPQHTDAFMIDNLAKWRGEKLLAWLAGRLDSTCKYVDLLAHTLWALFVSRPYLAESMAAKGLVQRIESVLDVDAVSARSRRELGEVGYLLRALSSKGS